MKTRQRKPPPAKGPSVALHPEQFIVWLTRESIDVGGEFASR
ncbi:hypothetical protein [Candidatus Pantoea multigeneris]|nr:hypothetical protein [Pantoea multigeneris]